MGHFALSGQLSTRPGQIQLIKSQFNNVLPLGSLSHGMVLALGGEPPCPELYLLEPSGSVGDTIPHLR